VRSKSSRYPGALALELEMDLEASLLTSRDTLRKNTQERLCRDLRQCVSKSLLKRSGWKGGTGCSLVLIGNGARLRDPVGEDQSPPRQKMKRMLRETECNPLHPWVESA
jgi:hypothetical protein